MSVPERPFEKSQSTDLCSNVPPSFVTLGFSLEKGYFRKLIIFYKVWSKVFEGVRGWGIWFSEPFIRAQRIGNSNFPSIGVTEPGKFGLGVCLTFSFILFSFYKNNQRVIISYKQFIKSHPKLSFALSSIIFYSSSNSFFNNLQIFIAL